MKFTLGNRKKVVVKIGSSLLVENGDLREEWMKRFICDISDLVAQDYQVIIVSSGAVALGRGFLKIKKKKLTMAEKQAAAAIGQIQLMSFYKEFFAQHSLDAAQILLTALDCNDRQRYLNAKNTIDTLIDNGIIPIINENDAVAVDEIKIGDNDRLSARVVQMVSADLLILFSDIDGLYNKNPKTDKTAKLVSEVRKITKETEKMASGAVSAVGTGGMVTKIQAAKMAVLSSCDILITSGLENNALKRLLDGKQKYTIFHSNKVFTRSRKNWLAGFLNTRGSVVINAKAKDAVMTKRFSLLTVGVTKVNGHFEKGEAIFVKDKNGKHIASGISEYNASDAKKIIGKSSDKIKEIFGKKAKSELVHISNMVVIG